MRDPVDAWVFTMAVQMVICSHAANRNRDADRAHLLALLDKHASAHPQPDATHFSGPIGRDDLKWESHTEFVTLPDGAPNSQSHRVISGP